MSRSRPLVARIAALAAAAGLMLPAAAGRADDTALFTAAVPPNVVLVIDNSGSMNEVVWHPAFDDVLDPICDYWDNDRTYFVDTTESDTFPSGFSDTGFAPGTYSLPGSGPSAGCVTSSRQIFIDPLVQAEGNPTRWSGRYLNWYYSPEAAAYYTEITPTNNGTFSSCLGGGTFSLYRRARVTAAKNILKDVICQVNQQGKVRFGLAQFRKIAVGSNNDTNGTDVNGGYILVPANDYYQADGVTPNVYTLDGISQSHGDHLIDAIESLEGETWTPLAESLFQVYTYFMSRTTSDIPFGKDGLTRFPKYAYRPRETGAGGDYSTLGAPTVPDSPVQYSCQKNFVVMITDGEPTRDDFDITTVTTSTQGFDIFQDLLIGDYNPDGENEEPPPIDSICGISVNCELALYLDDVAKFMHEVDFRPDMDGDQTLDVYTVGFTTTDFANDVLAKTAAVSNGQFFFSNNAEELSAAIVNVISDIIQKSQSFTAATVPASRTADGEQLYVSLFTPKKSSPYWEGHLRSYRLTGTGQILDANGSCAVDDPTGDCFSGSFLPTSSNPPYWDAADQMPTPDSRDLRVSVLRGALLEPTMVEFVHETPVLPLVPPADAVAALDLGITWPVASPPTGSVATNAEEYAAEVVGNVRGCEFGTGANGVACVERPTLLGDIFHSNPVVVGQPPLFEADASYKTGFKGLVGGRDRLIYAGDNNGFLHGFHAGDWNPAATPPQYDAGTGAEVFGFMPWPARQNIRHKPLDTSTRDYYYVDGSPTAADVWLYSDYSVASKLANGSEWRTVLVGGLRQGGEAYYAIDISDPSAATCSPPGSGNEFPCYLWEFPRETDGAAYQDYVAQTWGDPIVTRIRVDVGGVVMERWVAVVTGGYHPKSDPNDFASYDPAATEGRSLWVIDVKTGEPIAWRKFDTAGNCSSSDPLVTDELGMCYAFTAAPAVFDTDGDRYSDVIYAGDLGGNVWKWVIREPLRLSAATTAIDQNADWPFRKFFSAPPYDSGTNLYYKSFFFPPAGTRKNGKVWLAIGSGQRNNLLFAGDPATTDDNNRFYVIEEIDLFDQLGTAAVVTEADLTDLTSNNTCANLGGARGYFVIGGESEKWVTNVEIFAGYVIANSYVSEALSSDPCEISGNAFLWVFRVECGEGFFTDASGGASRTLDIGAGLPTDPRVTVGASGDVSDRVITSKQGGGIVNVEPPAKAKSGALYWRELTQ